MPVTAKAIADFQARLPHRHQPYTGRAWGHPLHSLCSYQGKLKPGLAHWLVDTFTKPGQVVLDPLAGVGTIPLEASLTGRVGLAGDLSPLAATVTTAKLRPLSAEKVTRELALLKGRMESVTLTPEDSEAASFGLNATVADYYHPQTLDEVLRARRVFLNESNAKRPIDPFVWASLLHILHGNRPYALSRTSHPITPFSPTGPTVYKSLLGKLRERIARALATPLPQTFVPGQAYRSDFRLLRHSITQPVDAIITSPPFMGIRFDRPNWLRLWFCGWLADDFHVRSLQFLEREQTKTFDCYEDFFLACHAMLRDGGTLIIHIGSGKSSEQIDALRDLGSAAFCLTGEVVEDVAGLEQHGLKDKGRRTTAHHLLFFAPR